MANCIDEIGAVHGVEMEIGDAAFDQVHDLLGGHGGSYEMGGLRVVVEPVEAARHPRRHGGAAAARRERAGRERWRGTERRESGGKAQSGGRALDFIKHAGHRAPKLAHAQPLFRARAQSFPDVSAISTLFSTVIFILYLIFISTSLLSIFFSTFSLTF